MILTEEEAKTKICHETLAATGMAATVHLSGCIGSACMAWRWWLGANERVIDRTQDDDRSVGYCGKAGRP